MAISKPLKKLLGEKLIEKGAITKEQLWEALRIQSKTGELLGRILVNLGMVSEEVIAEVLGIQEVTSLAELDLQLLKIVPEWLIRQYKLIPICKDGKCLTVAMADPMNVLAIDDLRLHTGLEIEPVKAEEKEIEAAIQKYFGLPEMEKALLNLDLTVEPSEHEAVQIEEDMVNEAPVIRLVNSLFIQAIEEKASDIHIEPQEHNVRVRYRVDGILREAMILPRKIRSAVTSRLKIMSGMDIAERRIPQDGRIQIKYGQSDIDLRISTLPTVYGEKVAIRLLDKEGMKNFKIAQLGFQPLNLERFSNALRSSYGMILITGPTGSGKTTTLYAAINTINDMEKNIVTVEDPVEYLLEGINQTQVNVKAGMTFAAGLRSILRQDPDIIMVGEIRDGETAEIAVRAAITGHLVLSTLHTTDAVGTVTRLIDMGIESFLVASSISCVVAQRLIRCLCPHCRIAYQVKPNSSEGAFAGLKKEETFYQARGCRQCNKTGYRGRTPICEVLNVSVNLRSLISKGASKDEIKEKALQEGMITLKEDGLKKAREGVTSLREIMRVAYTDEN